MGIYSHIELNLTGLQELARTAPDQVDEAVKAVAFELQGDIQLSFNTSPPGRTYGKHVASAPGYPPNVDTGTLRASIRASQVKEMVWQVTAGTDYAIPLEFGTPRMQARPFFRPKVEGMKKKMPSHFKLKVRAIKA
jgi:HK97 gp10 family phage protein